MRIEKCDAAEMGQVAAPLRSIVRSVFQAGRLSGLCVHVLQRPTVLLQ